MTSHLPPTTAPKQQGVGMERTPGNGYASKLVAALRVLRIPQWSKNVFVLLALVFARRLSDPDYIGRAVLATFAFCFAASAVYIINDIADRESDRHHPRKRFRPIASGRLPVPAALIEMAISLIVSSVFVTLIVVQPRLSTHDPYSIWGGSGPLFAATIASYVLLNVAYSLWLKHQVLWDVFLIAAGFVLRAMAGAFALAVPISPWFYLCATFLALFLALGKRRSELVRLSDHAPSHRRNLREYTPALLDQLIVIVVTSTLLTYSLYTFQGENSSHALMLTIPIVLFGIFRYLYLIYVRGEGDRPDELLWRDPQILGAVALYAVVVLLLLYAVPAVRS